MAGVREMFINSVDYFYLKLYPEDIPMKEKHLKDSTENMKKSMSGKWHKTKNTQQMYESIAKAENISISNEFKTGHLYTALSKQIHK